MRVHFAPPSSLLKIPPLSASTKAHTRPGWLPETATPTLPTTPSGRPPASFFQVSPPSVDLNSPPPLPPLVNVQGWRRPSHIPAYRIRGLVGSMARSLAPVRAST